MIREQHKQIDNVIAECSNAIIIPQNEIILENIPIPFTVPKQTVTEILLPTQTATDILPKQTVIDIEQYNVDEIIKSAKKQKKSRTFLVGNYSYQINISC